MLLMTKSVEDKLHCSVAAPRSEWKTQEGFYWYSYLQKAVGQIRP